MLARNQLRAAAAQRLAAARYFSKYQQVARRRVGPLESFKQSKWAARSKESHLI